MKRTLTLTDPDAAVYFSDAYGDVLAGLYVHDLDDWAWLLGRVEDWIAHAGEAVHDDYAEFVAERDGPRGAPDLAQVMWVLAIIAARMRDLVDGAPE